MICKELIVRWFAAGYLEAATDDPFTTISTTGNDGTAVSPYIFSRSMSFGTAKSNFSATFWSACRKRSFEPLDSVISTVANRIVEISPDGVIDRVTGFEEYLEAG
jgi:hypothetical protein